jgi:hypothetical protein
MVLLAIWLRHISTKVAILIMVTVAFTTISVFHNEDGDIFSIYATSPSIIRHELDDPDDGRPEDYYSAIIQSLEEK